MSELPEQNGPRLTGGGLLARNAYINLIGQGAPILVAIFAIPVLIEVLGTERFGVLALAWVVMGYFGLFDLGLGRATTKFVAEYHARNETEAIPRLVWSSLVVHVLLGLFGGAVLALLTPLLTQSILNLPDSLLVETKISFYILAVSVPLVVATAALRGVLEALQRFDLVNWIKIPANVANYLSPLFVLVFFEGLEAVVGFLVLVRGLVLLAYFLLCLRALPALSRRLQFDATLIKPLVSFGGWLTVSNVVGPSMASIDRFMIGAYVSLSAVTLYATPFEVVTKLAIFPTALLAVLFPAFSALAVDRAGEIHSLYLRAIRYLLALVAPIVGVLLSLSYDLLGLWIEPAFASESAPVAQWLLVGMLLNVLSQVPVTVLQGLGRADVTGKLLLIQLPLYFLSVWFLVELMGIIGVAIAWTIQIAFATIVLFVAAAKLLPPAFEEPKSRVTWLNAAVVSGFLLAFLSVGVLTPEDASFLRVAVVALLVVLFVLWEWIVFFGPADRRAFLSVVRTRGLKSKDVTTATDQKMPHGRSRP